MNFCKKNSIKTIALFVLALTASLMLFWGNALVIHADSLASLTGVSLSGNELSWDDFAGADHYHVMGHTAGSSMTETDTTSTSVDLYQFLRQKQQVSGDYEIIVYAVDDDYNTLSAEYKTNYSYTSTATRLAAPTNLKWTGATISWDAVENARYYGYSYYIDGTYQYGTVLFGTSVTLNNLKTCTNYTFSVYAVPIMDENYIPSEEATSAVKNFPNVVPSFTNVAINAKGELSFDEIPYAAKYDYSISYGGGTFYTNYLDLCDRCASHSFESGTYDIKLKAFGENDEPLCPEYVISNWEYDSSKAPAKLTGTAQITGDLKYGATLTASLIDSNNSGTLSYYWVRYKMGDSAIVGHGNTYTVDQGDIGGQLMVVAESSVEKTESKALKQKRFKKQTHPPLLRE